MNRKEKRTARYDYHSQYLDIINEIYITVYIIIQISNNFGKNTAEFYDDNICIFFAGIWVETMQINIIFNRNKKVF